MHTHEEIPHRFIDGGTLSGPVLQTIIADAEKHIEDCRRRIKLGLSYSAHPRMMNSITEEMERQAITAIRARTLLDLRTISRSQLLKKS